MKKQFLKIGISLVLLINLLQSCKIPTVNSRNPKDFLSQKFSNTSTSDTQNIAQKNWKIFYQDENLVQLIDYALQNNQELQIFSQEIAINQYEIQARKGEYLPFVNWATGLGLEKESQYTKLGAVEENVEYEEGKHFPRPMPDFNLALNFRWELDIWKKLRNAKKATQMKYFASNEGRNFLVTQLVSEIAENYYELIALDNLLQTIEENIEIQTKALKIVKEQKIASKVSQLAVNRFEAQLLKTQNLKYQVLNRIIETENRIHYLLGRNPQPISRSSNTFWNTDNTHIMIGNPQQLLVNRPDIQKALYEIQAAKLETMVAKAEFYPSLGINILLGIQSFDPTLMLNPHAFLFRFISDLTGPLVNKNSIKANYYTANAKQIQAVLEYEKTCLNAFLEVRNQYSFLNNFAKSYEIKKQEVDILMQSINIANNLFISARADYLEILLTQTEALSAKLELIEIKLNEWKSKIGLYRALGGGWR